MGGPDREGEAPAEPSLATSNTIRRTSAAANGLARKGLGWSLALPERALQSAALAKDPSGAAA